MARNIGVIRIKGSLGELSFYESDGKLFVRRKGGPDRALIMNRPSLKRMRENMTEFGGASRMGKMIRQVFGTAVSQYSDRDLSGRLTGKLKQMTEKCEGKRGMRKIQLSKHKNFLRGFEFNEKHKFGTVFRLPIRGLSIDAERKLVSLKLPCFDTIGILRPPIGSTHFIIEMIVCTVSDYIYSESSEQYHAEENVFERKRASRVSSFIEIGRKTENPIEMSCEMDYEGIIPECVNVVVGLGVMFFQKKGIEYYRMKSGHAFRVVEVF